MIATLRALALALVVSGAAGADALAPTPSQTEGPYYRSGSPPRTSLLEPGMPGARLMLRGRVLDIAGAPVTGARLDFWQADATGRYDNQGFRLRGHQRTDASGRYTLETVVPGAYYLRPPHIHVKLAAPRRATLTTQLYFPGEALNQSDSFYDPTLLVRMRDDADGKEASFDFVLR